MGIVKFLRSKLLNRRRRSGRADGDGEGGESCSGRCGDAAGAAVKRLEWGEIERITGGFAEVVGEGGFSTVYMGRLRGCRGGSAAAAAAAVAVKVHCGGGERVSLAFKQELDVLLRLKHENIVRLLGYCDDAGRHVARLRT